MKKYLLLTCALLISVPAYASTEELIDNVKNKNTSAVEKLLNNGENVNGANAQGNTALHYAVAGGNVEMVKLLLAHNADMNASNTKGWTPLKIAEKKNVGEVYNVLEEKIAVDKAKAEAIATKKAEELKKQEAEAKAIAAKLAKQEAEAKQKAEAEQKALQEAKAQKIKESQAKIEAEKKALTQKNQENKTRTKKAETLKVVAKKVAAKTQTVKSSAKNGAKAPLKKQQPLKKSVLSNKIYQGDEEIVYCLQYLGLQGEQKNMMVAAGYYAAENGVNKTRYDFVADEAKKYYENASEADIKSRADLCGKYITPKNATAQNKIIRSINRSIGF